MRGENMERLKNGKYKLDASEKKMIRILSANARTSVQVLSQELNLSTGKVKYKLERLTVNGVIRGFVVDIDWDKVEEE